MFFFITLKKDIWMPPSSFGPNLHEQIKQKLYREVAGTLDNKYGYIIMINSVLPIPRGQIQEGGHAVFPVTYQAIVFKPFRGEVLDTIVEAVEAIGFYCRAGPLRILVANSNMPPELRWNEDTQVIEDDKGTTVIEPGNAVRVRLVGLGATLALGTINENYLGVISSGR